MTSAPDAQPAGKTGWTWKRFLGIILKGMGIVVGSVGCLAMVTYMVLVVASVIHFSDYESFMGMEPERPPKEVFESATGLDWPADAVVLSHRDQYDNFFGDGSSDLTLKLKKSTIDSLLASPPPARFSDSTWRRGPIPDDMWALEDSIVRTPGLRYTAEERCCTDLPWHNGTVLILDRKHRLLILKVWDF